jgi:hypothetical protein
MVTKHRMAVNKDSMLYMIESRLSKKPAITQHRAQNIECTIIKMLQKKWVIFGMT